jgi:hypothetical protein
MAASPFQGPFAHSSLSHAPALPCPYPQLCSLFMPESLYSSPHPPPPAPPLARPVLSPRASGARISLLVRVSSCVGTPCAVRRNMVCRHTGHTGTGYTGTREPAWGTWYRGRHNGRAGAVPAHGYYRHTGAVCRCFRRLCLQQRATRCRNCLGGVLARQGRVIRVFKIFRILKVLRLLKLVKLFG